MGLRRLTAGSPVVRCLQTVGRFLIPLAVIFGLMGVINLAQGEFIMLGAYVTWLVQEALRHLTPAAVEWYLIIAVPVVFLVTAAIGIVLGLALLVFLAHRV